MLLILTIVLFVLMFIGVPIAISLSMAAASVIFTNAVSVPMSVVPQRLFTAIDSYALLAIPFFMLAGELMVSGSMAKRITDFAFACVGWVVGGLAQVSTLACMFFAGISGSGAADAAAVGKVMIPAMEKKGYDKGFASATVATASTIAVVLPPSIPLIVYGVTAGVSIGALFIAGIIPGILIGVSIMFLNYYISKKRGYDKEIGVFQFPEFTKAFKEGIWALLLPVIIIVGIRSGLFTPTESAAIAALYALFVGMFIYRDLKLKDLPAIFQKAAITTAMVIFIIAGANLFGWILAVDQIPQKLTQLIIDLTVNPYVILFVVNILLLIVGCFLNPSAAITILTPILLPIILAVNIDPIFFGLVMVVNLSIGLITPPAGLDLFVVQGISNIEFGRLVRACLPFILILIVDLMIITYIPQLTMWLPNVLNN